jgi:LysR family transcriptional regulator, glycine cleavage system transcriptional activator
LSHNTQETLIIRRLPPLNALRSFEAAGRHLHYGHAGDELSVTHSAVSKQVKVLEDFLQVPLFRRTKNGVRLTPEGSTLLPRVSKALDQLAVAARSVQSASVSGPLHISCPPSFASTWLTPRLGEFLALHPDVRLRVSTSNDVEMTDDHDFDIAIRFGIPQWQNRVVRLLSKVVIFPVCSPALIGGNKGIRRPGDLKHHTLLNYNDGWGWQDWLTKAGVSGVDSSTGPQFSDFNQVIVAARSGLGVALGDSVTVKDDLDHGILIMPFQVSIDMSLAYHLITLVDDDELPGAARAFMDWIIPEVRGD